MICSVIPAAAMKEFTRRCDMKSNVVSRGREGEQRERVIDERKERGERGSGGWG